jgi:excisionase family DNA binding protein
MKAPEAIEESATDADSEPTSDMPPLAPMLTVDEAAKLLCINRWTLYRLCNNGEFPCLRVGKSIRINPADIRTSLSGHP